MGIIQTARASGLKQFPLPYVLTNCHNSLCAVGGTINEDDHVFGLSAAKKYGGEFVPAHQAVIHSYMRERYAGRGKMILGSDSHTRYGAYGTMAIGEGGPELAQQLLNKTYDIAYPRVIAVYLTGAPRPGVGPQDVALDLIGATFKARHGEERRAGVLRPRRRQSGHGLPLRHRRDDHRDRLPVLRLAHRRHHRRPSGRCWAAGTSTRPMAPADGAYYDDLIEMDRWIRWSP